MLGVQGGIELKIDLGDVRLDGPITVGDGGVFGSVPEDRAGIYVGQEVTSAPGVNPTDHYAYGQRFIPTLIADSDDATLIGLETEPVFSATAPHTGLQGFAHYVAVVTDAVALTLVNAYGTFIDMASKGAGSAITNLYGLYINMQSGGAEINRAIHTAGGDHYFGGSATIDGNTTIKGGVWANHVGFRSDADTCTLVSNEPSAPIDHHGILLLASAGFGYLILASYTEDRHALVSLNLSGRTVSIVHDPFDMFSNTAGTAGKHNVFWSTVHGGFVVENERGAPIQYQRVRLGSG